MAIPAPAGPPVPYWPTVVVKPETVRGVQTYYVNLILDIIFGVFALIIGLSSIVVATATDLPAAIAFAAVFGAAACGLIIVFVINFIVSLMSVLRMHHGADEYGPEHAVNARRGVVFKWIGTTLSTLAAILVVYLLIAGSAVFIGGSSVPATVYVPLLITVFWTAGVSSKAQMYRFMVRSLQPPETRRWSDLASILIPVLGIGGIVVVGYFTVRILTLAANPTAMTPGEAAQLSQIVLGGVFLPPGFALIGYIIFLTVYGRTRDRLSQGLVQLYSSVPPPPFWTAPPTSPAPPVAAPSSPSSATPGTGVNFCPRCGHAVAADAQFCLNCGLQLRG